MTRDEKLKLLYVGIWEVVWCLVVGWMAVSTVEAVDASGKIIDIPNPWLNGFRYLARLFVVVPAMTVAAIISLRAVDKYTPGEWLSEKLFEDEKAIFIVCVLLYCVFTLVRYQ